MWFVYVQSMQLMRFDLFDLVLLFFAVYAVWGFAVSKPNKPKLRFMQLNFEILCGLRFWVMRFRFGSKPHKTALQVFCGACSFCSHVIQKISINITIDWSKLHKPKVWLMQFNFEILCGLQFWVMRFWFGLKPHKTSLQFFLQCMQFLLTNHSKNINQHYDWLIKTA